MKGLFKRLMGVFVIVSLVCSTFAVPIEVNAASDTQQVDGTTGTPLGGFGTGGVKFNARLGSFAALTKAPADANDYTALKDAKFQLYTNRNGSIKTVDTMKSASSNGRSEDDAIWPMHFANMGSTNDVQVNLKAFSPLDNVDYDNMSMPYAFYEMTLENLGDTSVDASCAFQLTTNDIPALVDGKGFNGKKWAIYGNSEQNGAIVSVGNNSDFNTTGVLDNSISGKTNKVAVKVNLDAKQSTVIRFVLAWYDDSEPDWHYYLNLYNNPGDIAARGLEKFDTLKNNAEILITKMRDSNLPDWFRNQIQNTLVNISNNSMYKKDGRVAYSEGQWTCFGTMDQMWQARQVIAQFIPFFAWRELEYWARTQRNDGQIHHDFNTAVENKADRAELVDWDYTEHPDYRNVDKWVDLNCGLIISVYETMQVAGNPSTDGIILGKDPIPEGTTMLDYFWPYLKKAGDRILKQVELYGNKTYPYTFDSSENSYDAGGNPNPYNASVSAVAYKIMARLADEMGETEEAAKYTTAYNTVTDSFAKRYLSNNFPEDKRVSESFLTGQWLSLHLKLGQIWTDEQTDYALSELDSFYHPYYWGMGTLKGTYNEWTPYTLMHYGGLLLQTRRENIFEAMQRDSYNRQYTDRNKVFNHPLDILPAVNTPNYAATTISGDKQYISMPGLWRNYNDVVGYYRDQRTKDIWVQPRLLPEMNNVMTDGMFVMPEGYGTVSCVESGEANQNQNMTVKSDNPIAVKNIHLSDNFGETNPVVQINGQPVNFTRTGTGYDKELVVEWNGTLDSTGITIETSGEAGYTVPALPEKPDHGPDDKPSGEVKNPYESISATSAEGKVKVDVETPMGQDWFVRNQFNYDSHIIFENVDFGDVGSNMISARVASVDSGFTLQVKLDAVSNDIIGTIEVPNTGDEQTWKEASCTLNETVKGKHDVIIVFDAAGASGEDAKFVNLNSIKFLQADGRLDRSAWKGSASNNSSSTYAAWDGDLETKWHCSWQEVGKYMTINFGKTEKFNKIVIDNNTKTTDHPKGYALYVSNDGKNFGDPIVTGNPEQDTKLVIEFPEQQAQYIKIVITEANSSKYWAVNELNVFMEKEPEPEETDPAQVGVFSGTSSNHPTGTKYFNITKNYLGSKPARVNSNTERAKFVDGIDAKVKAIFADKTDETLLREKFTQTFVNYIGKSGDYDVKPTIADISLPAGKYSIYYFGGEDLPVIVDLPDAAPGMVTVDASKPSYAFATIGTKTHNMKEISLTVSQDYTGDITFYNENGWLPDLYSLVIMNDNAPQPQLVTEITGYSKDTGVVSISRGEDFPENAVVVAAGYTDDVLTDVKYAAVESSNEIEVGTVAGDTVKVYLWDSLENMNPLCEAY